MHPTSGDLDPASRPARGGDPDELGKTPVRAAVASWIGSLLEYYDFFIYGTAAALVFGKVFFPAASPAAGTLLSLATYGVAYVARPVGAIFMGHLGDRYGRKRVLVVTVAGMGLATFLVGCLPTYDDIGIWAPIMLVILRLLQGLAASGEQAGANSLSLEHAPDRRRAYFTSFTLVGTQAGLVIATALWLPISSLPQHELLSWGWRIPFLLSAVVAITAIIIRRRLEETPSFQRTADEPTPSLPATELLRSHRADLLRVTLGALASTVSTIVSVWALSFAVDTVKLDDTTMLWVLIVSNLVALAAIPLWAKLADRIGRRPIFIFGALGSGALMFGYLGAIASGDIALVFLAGILVSGIVYSAQNAIWPALFGEMFPTAVRLSGVAIGTQIGFALGGLAPTLASAIAGPGPSGWVPVAALTMAATVAAAIAVATARETFDHSLSELDGDAPSVTVSRRATRATRAAGLALGTRDRLDVPTR